MTEHRYWLLRHGDALLMDQRDGVPDFPRGVAADFPGLRDALPVGDWRGLPCFAAELEELPGAADVELAPLRHVFGLLGMEAFSLAGRAVQLLDWQRHHRYCGACATPTEKLVDEFARHCPACGLDVYPRLSPAVMVLVKRGDQLLLARGPRFTPGMYSALAGFVEPGETLEQCAAREVREEVGIDIANLRYFGSQPWPFPNSLMVAFFADYAGGELRPDGDEIESAAWFPVTGLPLLPGPISIARWLIDAVLREA
jgi:NAD+ diphosphatase